MSNQVKAWKLYLKGNKLAEEQKIEDAIAVYKESIDLYPHHEEVYNNLGVLYHDLGKHEDATAFFEQGIAIAMKNTKAPSSQFNPREVATILAALRLFQRTPSVKKQLLEYFEETEPLTASEIDELCERLNCSWSSTDPASKTLDISERLTALGEIEVVMAESYRIRTLTRIWATFPEITAVEFAEIEEGAEVTPGTIALTDIKFISEDSATEIIKRNNLELVADQYRIEGDSLKFWQYLLLSTPPTEGLVGRHHRPEELSDLIDTIEQISELGKRLAIN
ncbi:tetratricopeptide repeat protein [Cyanothece sp. BG0011]|uniref:tetratricopeptide repeat protein n=1 Tax=Cyanothece sp. BG0011 TaxID=2082950 RepID=UPI000D1F832B|nr:tetratricopeptide repeat protein [Cyanothece sp. BG0011]